MIIKGKAYLLLALFFSISSHSFSANEPLKLDYSYEVALDVEHDIKDFDKVEFAPFDDLNLGFYKGELWIRLRIENSDIPQTVMFLNNDLFNRNYALYKTDSAQRQIQKVSVNTTYDGRSFDNAYPNFKINLQPNERATYIIVGKSDGRSTDASPKLLSLEDYHSIVDQAELWSIVFFSVIFILLILNIFLWSLSRHNIYIYYIIYMLITLMMYAGFEGVYHTFSLNALLIDHLIFILVRAWILSLIIFTVNFLDIRKISPSLYTYSIAILVVVLCCNTLYQLIFYKSSIQHLHYYENTLSFFYLFLILGFVLLSYKKRKLELKYYLIPFSFFLTFVIVGLIDGQFQIFPWEPFVYIKMGTLVEFVGFTYFMTVLIKKKLRQSDSLQDELHQKNEELASKSKKLEELSELINTKTTIEKTDLVSVFSLLENSLKSDKDWESFKAKFEELNPDFLNNLISQNPDLSKSEIRLLTLIKIGYSQKEIATILNIAPESVKKARSRVRKKMSISNSININDYLAGFE